MFFLTEERLETREEANHVSCGLLQSAPPALNDPPTAQRSTPMAHRDHAVSKYKTKQQTNRKDCNNKGDKNTKRLSESMVSVKDDCQGMELKQTNRERMKHTLKCGFPSHVDLMLSHSTSKILYFVVLACTSTHAGL